LNVDGMETNPVVDIKAGKRERKLWNLLPPIPERNNVDILYYE
jgi:hypothetical protein